MDIDRIRYLSEKQHAANNEDPLSSDYRRARDLSIGGGTYRLINLIKILIKMLPIYQIFYLHSGP